MELKSRVFSWARLSEPGAKSFLLQALLGGGLTFLFWLLQAAIDYFLFGGNSFYKYLLHPDRHQAAEFSLVVFLVCCLLLYSRHSHQLQAQLQAALKTALDKSEDDKVKLRGIVEAMGDAISIQAPDMTIVYQNRAHVEMMGQHVGEPCYQAYRQEKEICPGCHLAAAFADGKVHRAKVSPEPGNGNRYVEITGSVLNGADGRPALGIEVVRDVTAQRLVEREAAQLNLALTRQATELKQVNRELEAFCLAVAHDLRAPLTRIYSSAQELQGYCDLLDENGRFFVSLVNDGCVHMESMIEALMILCHVTEMEMAPAPVDLAELVQELAAQLQLDHPGRKVTLRLPERLVVQGDRELLRIAMENLLSNAWKYTSHVAMPLIELGSFGSEQGELVIFLRDNGAGFDNARAEELFKPFRRLHSALEFPGTGLGLATVRRIIRRHNGQIWGDGTPGAGATFYFTVNG
ncbi:sensor histidine kinase, putative heme-binding site [Citrifermentans bemidjiense Bem]|uniref:histidine kinase n=1 Tax=Citrifermentans bemidjiense (strain ATCC BAA-1014 / DSM 16622 / JCM 12645 / Bem) TaxID=404380 RepID=B5EFZ8_CITBB|nr:ATP-binding protein [Citrifermentans bemidjiense]ACH39463.1 sensor histidine kinase, putative heme-binding site [Citrifermentans bemidjiense Bem]